MVKSLSFMKVVAENVHLISKNPLGDPICRSWTVEYLFKFRNLGSIDMQGNLQYNKCTHFKSDSKKIPPKPKPKPKPDPKPTPKDKLFLLRQLQFDDDDPEEDLEDIVGRSKALLDTNFFFNLFCIIPNIFMTTYILEIGLLVYKYKVLKNEKDDRLIWLKRYKRLQKDKSLINKLIK